VAIFRNLKIFTIDWKPVQSFVADEDAIEKALRGPDRIYRTLLSTSFNRSGLIIAAAKRIWNPPGVEVEMFLFNRSTSAFKEL
jgi:hypothetical protein